MFVRWLPTVTRVSLLLGNLYSHALGTFHSIDEGVGKWNSQEKLFNSYIYKFHFYLNCFEF